MTGTTELQDMLDFAISIATRSGVIARKHFRSSLDIYSKSERQFDPVTRADRDIEKYLRGRIHKRYPGHGIIGEEHSGNQGSRYTWVIDPIDGTRGYISGSPMWGILLGLMDKRRPVIGLMHQPYIRETFYAGPQGAWLKSGKQLKILETSKKHVLSDAILYCTHPWMFTRKSELMAFQKVERVCQYSRFGADCYGYCLLAAGFVDIVIEADLHAYDIIPLIPIIKSAGGVITDWEGKQPLQGGQVIAAANRKIHRQAMHLLNQ
jgi:myo-inositol-1(or 4)-monophosphatase